LGRRHHLVAFADIGPTLNILLWRLIQASPKAAPGLPARVPGSSA
jgi:hypothetical protein